MTTSFRRSLAWAAVLAWAVALSLAPALPAWAQTTPKVLRLALAGQAGQAEWKRGARIVLQKNPAHRHSVYDAQPNADEAAGQALAAKFRSRPLPQLDRVEITFVEEAQPRWLSFLNHQIDMVARAKALLDRYGYVDKDGDGWRDLPDGKPLAIEHHAETTQLSRDLRGLWQKAFTAVGVTSEFRTAQWQENIKASRAGKLMTWNTGWVAALPDASYFIDVMYGADKGMSKHARMNLPALNALHEQQRALPDGPEGFALVQQALKLGLAYMPMKATNHPTNSWMSHAGVEGYVPHPFIRDYWRFMSVESAAP
jgi:ABC-type transport system substrate-binding protein